jgi:hypothetical protein
MFAEDVLRMMPQDMAWRWAFLANAQGETVWQLFRE